MNEKGAFTTKLKKKVGDKVVEFLNKMLELLEIKKVEITFNDKDNPTDTNIIITIKRKNVK